MLPRNCGAFFMAERGRTCSPKRRAIKNERHEVPAIDSFVAPHSGISEANPCFSAGKLNRLQVIGFEGGFLFELFSTIYSSLN
jgi:hypothetical protein